MHKLDIKKNELRLAAQSWFSSSENVEFFKKFEKQYLETPRKLFIEIALARCIEKPCKILDIGCGTGEELLYLKSRLPETELIGIDTETAMVTNARMAVSGKNIHIEKNTIEKFKNPKNGFDLILCHSNFRLWPNPLQGLKKLVSMLNNQNAFVYILDLHRDISNELREHILERMEDNKARKFWEMQLESSYTIEEIKNLLTEADIKRYELGIGGLAGNPTRSSKALKLIQNHDRIAELVFRLSQDSFRSEKAADAIVHLFLYKERGNE